jgi:hypothetical protein
MTLSPQPQPRPRLTPPQLPPLVLAPVLLRRAPALVWRLRPRRRRPAPVLTAIDTGAMGTGHTAMAMDTVMGTVMGTRTGMGA